MNRNNLKTVFGIISVALLVIAIVAFAIGVVVVGGGDAVLFGWSLVIVGVLCFAAALEFAYMFYIEREVKPNFFLYDANSKRNMDVQKMTFDVINRKLSRYLASFAQSEGKLWTDGILENPNLDMEEQFKPAVAYRLLFGLAEKDMDQGWKCFEVATPETVEFICSALDSNGDTEVARTLRHLKAATPMNIKYVISLFPT